jgi:hypothetical protein
MNHNDVLQDMIDDITTIDGFLAGFADKTKPLYNETQAAMAREISLMLRGAVGNAMGGIAQVDRDAVGVSQGAGAMSDAGTPITDELRQAARLMTSGEREMGDALLTLAGEVADIAFGLAPLVDPAKPMVSEDAALVIHQVYAEIWRACEKAVGKHAMEVRRATVASTH